jgi:polyhydroxyalkanoate synthesis regulator phasin
MTAKPIHPHVEFAVRHSKTSLSTLNAHASIFRAENLLEDIEQVDVLIKHSEAAGNTKGRRWFWLEIISYYAVAFVTCLEWHARSRLVDLFSFRPNCIRADDLKGISDKVLPQMVAEGITVPQLLGAMTAVGSSQKYIAIFERIFKELEIKLNPYDVLNSIILRDTSNHKVDALQGVFDYRNNLVHEIDYSMVGPWVVRGNLDVANAREHGQLVLAVMKTIEKTITDHAPKDFPNRLDNEGLPDDEMHALDQKIAELEDDITDAIRSVRGLGEGSAPAMSDWFAALSNSRSANIEESKFIQDAEFIHSRHADFRRPLLIALRKQRLEYLRLLRAEL